MLVCPSTFHKRSAALLVGVRQKNRKGFPRDLLSANPYLSGKAIKRFEALCRVFLRLCPSWVHLLHLRLFLTSRGNHGQREETEEARFHGSSLRRRLAKMPREHFECNGDLSPSNLPVAIRFRQSTGSDHCAEFL